jgi:hypothetical protein
LKANEAVLPADKGNANVVLDTAAYSWNGTRSEELSRKKHDALTTIHVHIRGTYTCTCNCSNNKSSSFPTRYIVTPDDGLIGRNKL